MKKITVTASKTYPVIVGSELLDNTGSYVVEICKAEKAVIISDSNVWPIYGERVVRSLQASSIDTTNFIFPAGEQSKTLETYISILNFLAQNHVTRSDLIIALGGGVTGDITGFVAATYLRGISYIQIPTSLLAMVDSSVGGKTAIDLPAGKNLVGAFYQPRLVLCDTGVLRTLSANIFRDGCAEVIKYGILYDAELFAHLAANGLAFDRETVIARCVELKRDVVAVDEFDNGARQKLNLGHTFGHAIELLSQFSLSHGKCVAIGMSIIARTACNLRFCSQETTDQILQVLENFELPIYTNYSTAEILQASLSDKKRFGDAVNLIVPRQIGYCDICRTPVDRLESFIKAGL